MRELLSPGGVVWAKLDAIEVVQRTCRGISEANIPTCTSSLGGAVEIPLPSNLNAKPQGYKAGQQKKNLKIGIE